MSQLHIEPLHADFGATVTGIDLTAVLFASATGQSASLVTDERAPIVKRVEEVLTTSPAVTTTPTLDLIKMDADGPEGGWLRLIDRLISANRLAVRSIIVEGSDLDPAIMRRFQTTHGYSIWR